MATVLLLNGPNLNLLGIREPEHYGSTSLEIIETKLQRIAKQHGHNLVCFQSNAEHELINRIHATQQEAVVFILINAAALTHTSIALRDALSTVGIPFIEIHISNIYARESFRHYSYLADIAVGQISGLGGKGYELALLAAIDRIANDVA